MRFLLLGEGAVCVRRSVPDYGVYVALYVPRKTETQSVWHAPALAQTGLVPPE